MRVRTFRSLSRRWIVVTASVGLTAACSCTIHVGTSGEPSSPDDAESNSDVSVDEPQEQSNEPDDPDAGEQESNPSKTLQEPPGASPTPTPDGDPEKAPTADQQTRRLLAAIRAGDVSVVHEMMVDRTSMGIDGTDVPKAEINTTLLERIAAFDQGGPAPRVEVRCAPPERSGVHTCTIFQTTATWTVRFQQPDADTMVLTELTREP